MLLFEKACELGQDEDDWVPEILEGLCWSYLRLHVETLLGYILGWWSYLFEVVWHTVLKN